MIRLSEYSVCVHVYSNRGENAIDTEAVVRLSSALTPKIRNILLGASRMNTKPANNKECMFVLEHILLSD